ncbi:GTP cyclohydrolase I [Sphaerisporangium sp. NPDC051017]|uniref:GTP cyclohydrolase I n=1 Tax=Sphaerisporangium sp. NPDC051017 TaxID=3154636 RepID=UPI00343B5AFA
MSEIIANGLRADAAPRDSAERRAFDQDAVEHLIRQLLTAIGEDPDRDGLKDTPRRVAAWWAQFLTPDPGVLDTVFDHDDVGDQWVAVSDIEIWTICEHHLLPFRLSLTIGYIPAGRVIGLSKIARIALRHAAGLQLQERLTAQIAQTLASLTGSPDVGVWATGEHLCMSMRGVRATRARTRTGCLLGRLRTEPGLGDRLLAATEQRRHG